MYLHVIVDPEMELGAARRTQRLADQMNEDADMRSFQSRNKDRDLMNEITQRLVCIFIILPYF